MALAPLSLALLAEPLPAFSAPTPLPSAKGRAISLPMDLDAHISSLLSSGTSCVAAAQRNASNYKTATRAFPRVMPTANQWDYKNIIEKLQVGGGLCSGCVLSGLSTPRPPEGAGYLVPSWGPPGAGAPFQGWRSPRGLGRLSLETPSCFSLTLYTVSLASRWGVVGYCPPVAED